MRGHVDILTLSLKSTFPGTIFQKNNCYRSTTLLFGLGQTIDIFGSLTRSCSRDKYPKVTTGVT